MKLYQVRGEDAGNAVKVEWVTSRAEATRQHGRMKKSGLLKTKIEEVDIPVTKIDLLTWLNKNNVAVA